MLMLLSSFFFFILFLNTPLCGKGGGILESLCQSVHLSICCPVGVSDFVWMISPEPLNHFNQHGLVVYYHEKECHAEKKLVHYFQCEGHSKGLYYQNVTFYSVF